jgi:hypothetical protein
VKKILLLLVPIILISLSGCLNYIQDSYIYSDGSGRMRIIYWTKLPENKNAQILEKVGIFNPDSIRSEFTSKYCTIKDIKVYTDSTDSTTHAVINLNFDHIDSLNNMKAFAASNFALKDGAPGQKIFTQFVSPLATGFGFNAKDFHVTYKYTFNGDIITDNSTSKEGRTLIWDYNLSDIGNGKTISVTFKPFRLKETPPWVFMLSGFVLLIVIIFLLKKKKD